MIRHTVVFRLKHFKDSSEEKKFLEAMKKLSSIPGVNKFELLRQVSSKNNYDFGLSMEFGSSIEYEAYNRHPNHTSFVETYWLNEVSGFLEIDFEPYN